MIHVGSKRRANRTPDQNRFLVRQRVVDLLPTGFGHVGHSEPGVGLWRAAVSRDVDGDAAVPGRQVSHLKNPARLIHRVGMNKGDHRPRASHPFVVKRSLNMLRHNISPCQAVEKGSFASLHSTDFVSTYKSTPPLFYLREPST